MARITVTVVGDRRAGDRYYVSVRGRLSRRDLKRLERVCGPALEHRTPPLEIRIEDPSDIDESASFFLNGLRARGAVVTGAGVRFSACADRD